MRDSLPVFIESVPRDRPAVADVERRLTYGELCDAARRASTWCVRRFGRKRFVVVKATPNVAYLEMLLGVIYSGNVIVPIDPMLPHGALAFVLAKCQAEVALEPAEAMAEARHEAASDGLACAPDDAAMVMFTSGTTGMPKGVVMTHANLGHSWLAISEYLGFDKFRSTISVLPLHYSYGLISQVLCMLSNGGYVRLMPGLRNPLAFARAVMDEEIETFCGVPTSFALLSRFHRLRPIILPSMRVVCSAGAAFDMDSYSTIKQIFPNAEIFNNYGMTEACPRISYVSDQNPMFFEGSCGVPIKGVELVTLDPQTLHILPEGEEGVLGVKGPNVMRGYLDDDVLNRNSFQQDGFLVSGDVARIERGHLFLRGRLDDMFNVGGEKVAPIEIEKFLNMLPQVESSAVRGIMDPDRGQVVVAFLILASPVNKQQLDHFLSQHLIPIKIPVAYYEVSELPMTGSGKIQRGKITTTSEYVKRLIA